MALFLSTHLNKIDGKGRVSVPAGFRAALGQQTFHGIVVFPSYELGTIDACGIDRMEALSASLDAPDQYSAEEMELALLSFSEAQQVAIDADGRIVLPRELAQHAGINEQALFVGLGPTFQIWQPERYQAYKKKTVARAADKGTTLRLRPIPFTRKPGGGGNP